MSGGMVLVDVSGKATTVMSVKGDMVDFDTTRQRLAIGTENQTLLSKSNLPTWSPSSTSILTTTGDLLYASGANTLARLAGGTSGDILTANGAGIAPSYQTPAGGGAFSLLYDSGKLGVAGVLDSGASTFASHDYLQISIFAGLAIAEGQTIKFNNDGSTNYVFQDLRNGSTFNTDNYAGFQYTFGASTNFANSTWFINQRSGAEKECTGIITEQKGTAATDNPAQCLFNGQWNNTSSNINRVTICNSGGVTVNVRAGSQMIIWGA